MFIEQQGTWPVTTVVEGGQLLDPSALTEKPRLWIVIGDQGVDKAFERWLVDCVSESRFSVVRHVPGRDQPVPAMSRGQVLLLCGFDGGSLERVLRYSKDAVHAGATAVLRTDEESLYAPSFYASGLDVVKVLDAPRSVEEIARLVGGSDALTVAERCVEQTGGMPGLVDGYLQLWMEKGECRASQLEIHFAALEMRMIRRFEALVASNVQSAGCLRAYLSGQRDVKLSRHTTPLLLAGCICLGADGRYGMPGVIRGITRRFLDSRK